MTNPNDHGKAPWIWFVIALVGVLVLVSRRPWDTHFRAPDAYDYAQMGREWARGDGFATQQVFPRHVPVLHAHGLLQTESWPNLYRYPLPPLLHGLAQQWVDDPVQAGQWMSAVTFALACAVLAALGCHFFGPVAGTAAVLLSFADPEWWKSATQGLSEPIASAWLLLFLGLLRWKTSRTNTRLVVLGLVTAAAILTRTQLAFLGLLGVVTCLGQTHRWRGVATYGGSVLLGMAPWMARNLWVIGSPLFSFSSTRNLAMGATADLDMQLHGPVHWSDTWSQHGEAIGGKLAEQWALLFDGSHWADMYHGLPWIAVGGTVLFAALLAIPRFRHQRWWLGVGLAILFLNFAAVTLAFALDRFYLPTRALFYLWSGAALGMVVDAVPRQPLVKRVVAIGLLAAVTLVARNQLVQTVRPRPPLASLEAVKKHTQPEELIASDLSHRIVLETDRRSMRIPAHPEELLEIHRDYLPIDHLVLSGKVLQGGGKKKSANFQDFRAYRTFVRSEAFRELFQETADLPGGGKLYSRKQ